MLIKLGKRKCHYLMLISFLVSPDIELELGGDRERETGKKSRLVGATEIDLKLFLEFFRKRPHAV